MAHLQNAEQKKLAEAFYVNLMGWELYVKWTRLKIAAGMQKNTEREFIEWLVTFVERNADFDSSRAGASAAAGDAGDVEVEADTSVEVEPCASGESNSSEQIDTAPTSCDDNGGKVKLEADSIEIVNTPPPPAADSNNTCSTSAVFPDTDFPMLNFGNLLPSNIDFDGGSSSFMESEYLESAAVGSATDLLDPLVRQELESQGVLFNVDELGQQIMPPYYSQRAPGQGRKPRGVGPRLPHEAINRLQAHVKRGRPKKDAHLVAPSYEPRSHKHNLKVPADVLQKETERVLAMTPRRKAGSSGRGGGSSSVGMRRQRGRPRKSITL